MFKKSLWVIAALFLLKITPGLSAQDANLKAGWSSFIENDYSSARNSFLKAAQNPSTQAEGNLALLLLSDMVKSSDLNALETFQAFYNASENPNPGMFALWGSTGLDQWDGKLDKDNLAFLETVLESPNTDPTVRARVNQALFRHYDQIGKSKKGLPYRAAIGGVYTWSLLGEFENISGSGFNKPQEALEHPEQAYKFTNKKGAEVQWFPMIGAKAGDWINFGSHFGSSSALYFAQTFANSPSAKLAQLRIGTSGSLKIWVNDQLVFSEDEERNNGMDTYIVPIALNKGNNRILLQVGEHELGDANFLMRLTDNKGAVLSNITYSNIEKPYTKATGKMPSSEKIFAEKYYEDKLASEPENLLHHILLAKIYLRNDKRVEAREVLDQALEAAPKCTYILTQMAEVHGRNDNDTELSRILEQVKRDDPDNPLSLSMLYDEAVDKEDWDEAEEIYKKLSSGEENSEVNILRQIAIAGGRNETKEIVDLVDKGYRLYPENFTYVYFKYYLTKEETGNYAAMSILKKYIKKNKGDDEARKLLAGIYFELGQVYTGIDLFKQLAEENPSSANLQETLGEIYFNMRQYSTARGYFEKCLELAPYHSDYYGNVGKTYKEEDNTDRAIEYYQKQLYYNPYAYERREELRDIQGKEAIFKSFEEPDLEEIYANDDTKREEFPEDNSIILHYEEQRVAYEDGGSESKSFLLIKILDTPALDDWKEYNASGMVEEAKVFKKDGSKIDGERSGRHIVFTDLEVGDAIMVVSKTRFYTGGKLRRHYWDHHYFSLMYPTKVNKYSLLAHNNAKSIQHKVVNSSMQPTITEVGDSKLYVWEKTDQQSVKKESYMPSLGDIGEILHISTIPDWNFVVDWYYDIAKTKAKSSYETRKVAKELFAGKENLTETEKAKIIYDYIVKEIRYSSVSFRQSGIVPQKASAVINTKVGDCKDVSTLFIALCKEVGIDAHWVLVNTRDNGRLDLPLPSTGFNHCIAKVTLDNKVYYVELTSDKNAFSTFGSVLKEAIALDITDNPNGAEPQYLNPDSRIKNVINRETVVSFQGNRMMVKKKNEKTGSMASGIRNTYRDIGNEQRRKEMQEAISDDYANITLKDLSFGDNLNTTSSTVNYDYSYEVENVYQSVLDMDMFKLPWASRQKPMDFMAGQDREHPIELWRYRGSSDIVAETIVVEVPQGKKLIEVPKSVHLDCDVATYDLSYSVKNGQLVVTRKMQYKDDFITLSNYQQVKAFYEQVIKADDQQIVFKKQ